MYCIIETQTSGSSMAVVTPIPVYSDRNEAESAYHAKMSAAAVSSVAVHSVVMLDEKGCVILNGSYEHAAA